MKVSMKTILNMFGAGQEKELTRSDFKKVDIKGRGMKYYFSFVDKYLGVELCLEPCANGFDVGLYQRGNWLIGKKECTNLKSGIYKKEKVVSKENDNPYSFDKLMMQDFIHGTLERSEKAWDKGLKIANKLYRSYKNQERLKRWKMIPKDGGTKPLDEIPNCSPSIPPSIPNNPNPYGGSIPADKWTWDEMGQIDKKPYDVQTKNPPDSIENTKPGA